MNIACYVSRSHLGCYAHVFININSVKLRYYIMDAALFHNSGSILMFKMIIWPLGNTIADTDVFQLFILFLKSI